MGDEGQDRSGRYRENIKQGAPEKDCSSSLSTKDGSSRAVTEDSLSDSKRVASRRAAYAKSVTGHARVED